MNFEELFNEIWKYWRMHAPDKAKYKKASKERLKKYLEKNKDISYQDVLNAMYLYFEETERKYIRYPLYWVHKKVGDTKIYPMEEYIKRIKDNKRKFKIQ